MTDTRAEHIAQLSELIKDVEVAMFTTTGVDGRLYSRPLGTQQVDFDGDLWFATAADSPKVAEIALNPRVNVAYASTSKNTYVSVSGRARIVDDRARIEALWSPAMKLFFPGGKDDPNLRLIQVRAESAEYWEGPGTLLGKALSFVLSAVQDDPSQLGDNGFIDLR
ncbi:pyridoxamine 5'-phosphate oxidase family protein [Stenotrophomonas sp. ZAC14D2_NAIMI4_6]|uniref:pyridoxamine 5'-phosphate oxidase family protein n=1 Tax=Stenotrophomonas sp. ZAC14D2_NAIMI4_6 TaxID=2072406 RepID=UPI000D541F6B|nr:pyridoxamine 5'-phosphate oxidase family protein [Stenotrophomonas sp. ZAC14D2_NAIMI4_6]AWH21048.1 general stress protein [Stenotrophomonas sp. ZAC14D2_NAIMI4_6]